MLYLVASAADQVGGHWTQVPIASAAEIPKIDGVLRLVVYLQAGNQTRKMQEMVRLTDNLCLNLWHKCGRQFCLAKPNKSMYSTWYTMGIIYVKSPFHPLSKKK